MALQLAHEAAVASGIGDDFMDESRCCFCHRSSTFFANRSPPYNAITEVALVVNSISNFMLVLSTHPGSECKLLESWVIERILYY